MKAQDHIQFYRTQGEWSDPREFAWAFDDIPASVAAVTATVQGLLLHDHFGAHLYHDPPADIARASRLTLPVSTRIPALHDYDETPLTNARPVFRRTVGTCRDFALLTCSMLRHCGIAARVRCGFAHYFHPPTFEDHWICEYWDDVAQDWKMADAQLDDAHKQHLSVAFDHNDLPQEAFVAPWRVWEHFGHDPARLEGFGHGETRGTWFVWVNLARDLLALTKCEVSDWDTWRVHAETEKAADAKVVHCDALAAAGKLLSTARTVDPTLCDDLIARLKRPHWRS